MQAEMFFARKVRIQVKLTAASFFLLLKQQMRFKRSFLGENNCKRK
jgi:hypothetical protein